MSAKVKKYLPIGIYILILGIMCYINKELWPNDATRFMSVTGAFFAVILEIGRAMYFEAFEKPNKAHGIFALLLFASSVLMMFLSYTIKSDVIKIVNGCLTLGILYEVLYSIRMERPKRITDHLIAHAIFILLFSGSYWLQRYTTLSSDTIKTSTWIIAVLVIINASDISPKELFQFFWNHIILGR